MFCPPSSFSWLYLNSRKAHMCHGIREVASGPWAPCAAELCWGRWPTLLVLLFPQPPAHGIHVKAANGLPFSGHQGPSDPLPGQPLGTQGILKCFPCSPDISTSLCCFSPHCQVAARFSYSVWPLLQWWLESNSGPPYFASSPNASGISIISHLQGHQDMKYLLLVLKHFNFRFFFCQKLKCYLLWVKKLLRHHPSFFQTLLNYQALALDM